MTELLALSDGIGLVVSNEPIGRSELFWLSWVEEGILLLLVTVGIGIGRLLLVRRPKAPRPPRWTERVRASGLVILGLAGVAAAIAVVWHAVHDEGFFSNRPAMALVEARHFDPPLEFVSVDTVAALVGDPRTTLIDARLPQDYERGHLPGAINLSIVAGLVERRQVLADVPPGHRIIVYCQSESCHWGDAVAADLVFRGYRRVGVYRGGYREWESRERAKTAN